MTEPPGGVQDAGHRRSAEAEEGAARRRVRRRRLLAGIPAVLLGVLLAAELVARARGAHPVTGFVASGERGWAPQPGTRDIAGVPATVSPTGTRGAEAPPGGVLLLGDENAFGAGLRDEETLGAALARESGVPVTLAACAGYGTIQEFAWLRELEPRLKPRIVVIVYSLDDPVPFAATMFTSLRVFLQRHLALAAPSARPMPRAGLDALHDPDGVAWRLQKQTFRELGEWSRAKKVPVVVAVWPMLGKQDDALAEYFEAVRGEARINGLSVRNLAADLGGGDLSGLATPEGRPGVEAVRRAAAGLAAELREGE
ncbi:MAG: hypothetical protein IT452_21280 [Planctomycetia bacterium]|nr:hypothetical protein [Planctomycetia bacterium]